MLGRRLTARERIPGLWAHNSKTPTTENVQAITRKDQLGLYLLRKASYGQSCVKIRDFSLPWQQGRSEQIRLTPLNVPTLVVTVVEHRTRD